MILPHAQEQWIEIALDETQEPVSLEARAQSAHVMCIHMKIVRLSASGQAPVAMQVVLPTVILPGTTTEDLYGRLKARLPVELETLRSKAAKTTVLFNSDSFSSCLKLYKCLRDMIPCLHCPCRNAPTLHIDGRCSGKFWAYGIFVLWSPPSPKSQVSTSLARAVGHAPVGAPGSDL